MNVLVVVAHPDDEILGCGATMRRLRDEGAHVYTAVLCANADARKERPDDLNRWAAEAARMVGVESSQLHDFRNIRFNVVPHLELVNAVEEAVAKFRPEWIFTHHPGDLNIDHRVCHDATMAAVMLPQRLTADIPVTMIRRVWLCEIPSSTDWAPPTAPPFLPNTFVNVADSFAAKLAALEHFPGAMKPFPHSRSIENVRHLAHVRGGQVGIPLAEAFVSVRELIA